MKYQLSEIDKRVIDRASNITCVDYEIDNDNYIEADNLLTIIDDLEDKYDEIYNKLIEFDEKMQETWREHFINEQIDRGMHPHEYE